MFKKILKQELKKVGLRLKERKIRSFLHPEDVSYKQTIVKSKTILGIPFNGQEIGIITSHPTSLIPEEYKKQIDPEKDDIDTIIWKKAYQNVCRGLEIRVLDESERHNLERFSESYQTRMNESCKIKDINSYL